MSYPKELFVRTTYAIKKESLIRALLCACGLPPETWDKLHSVKIDTLDLGDGEFIVDDVTQSDAKGHETWIEVDVQGKDHG